MSVGAGGPALPPGTVAVVAGARGEPEWTQVNPHEIFLVG